MNDIGFPSVLKITMFQNLFGSVYPMYSHLIFLTRHKCDLLHAGVSHPSIPKLYGLLCLVTCYLSAFLTSLANPEGVHFSQLISRYDYRHSEYLFFVTRFQASQIAVTFFSLMKWAWSHGDGCWGSLRIQYYTKNHVQKNWWNIIDISYLNQLIRYIDRYSALMCGCGVWLFSQLQLYCLNLLYLIEVRQFLFCIYSRPAIHCDGVNFLVPHIIPTCSTG